MAQESACGSSSVTFSTYFAGVVAGKHLPGFESCCEAHDRCYDSCSSREQCDSEFGSCMRTTCAIRNSSETDYDECLNRSGMFQTAVETLGSFAYNENCTNELVDDLSADPVQLVYDFLQINTADIMEMFS
jgi:hypothetical protein